MKTNFYSRYNPPPSPSFLFENESMTQQQFKDDCDVNNIIARLPVGGQLPVDPRLVYADVADIPTDLMRMRDYINDAYAKFEEIPASIRDKYGHDPLAVLAGYQQELINETKVPEKVTDTVVQNSDPSSLDSNGSE